MTNKQVKKIKELPLPLSLCFYQMSKNGSGFLNAHLSPSTQQIHGSIQVFDFHFVCLPIPVIIERRCFRHSLKLLKFNFNSTKLIFIISFFSSWLIHLMKIMVEIMHILLPNHLRPLLTLLVIQSKHISLLFIFVDDLFFPL